MGKNRVKRFWKVMDPKKFLKAAREMPSKKEVFGTTFGWFP